MTEYAHSLGIILAYLLGSIPFGLILTKIWGLGDIRTVGSGNIGATNVLRLGDKKLAALVLLLDMAKGAAAVWVGHELGAMAGYAIMTSLLAGIAVVIGHIFPVWLKFKGGKGVATTLGVVLAAHFSVGVFAILIWLFVAWWFRYSSLAALTMAIFTPVYALVVVDRPLFFAFGILSILLFYTHYGNIVRLIHGKEGKIGETVKPKKETRQAAGPQGPLNFIPPEK